MAVCCSLWLFFLLLTSLCEFRTEPSIHAQYTFIYDHFMNVWSIIMIAFLIFSSLFLVCIWPCCCCYAAVKKLPSIPNYCCCGGIPNKRSNPDAVCYLATGVRWCSLCRGGNRRHYMMYRRRNWNLILEPGKCWHLWWFIGIVLWYAKQIVTISDYFTTYHVNT